MGARKQDELKKADPSSSKAEESAPRPGILRMGTWGFGGKNTGRAEGANNMKDEEDDDRRIRFTIGGAGRRLTKEDFLKEIQSLDPKARCEIIAESDAPAAMKDMARRDASKDSPGSSRIFGAKQVQVASGKATAKMVGAEMARSRGASVNVDEEMPEYGSGSDGSEEERIRRERTKHDIDPAKKDIPSQSQSKRTTMSRRLSKVDSPSTVVPESETERKRREQALKGVDDVTPAQRGRVRSAESDAGGSGAVEESAAEKRRREAAFGLGAGGRELEEDSDDDDTPRVPRPVARARARGIRFAQSPVRGRN